MTLYPIIRTTVEIPGQEPLTTAQQAALEDARRVVSDNLEETLWPNPMPPMPILLRMLSIQSDGCPRIASCVYEALRPRTQ